MDERSSDELYWQLMRDGMRTKTIGVVQASNGLASAPVCGEEDRKRRHSPSGGRTCPKRLPRLRIIRALPFLAVIDGGRAHD